tara:strand:- start:904 stop:1017 length:114 start_codon:yes stop_codon:yes gene_type:complete
MDSSTIIDADAMDTALIVGAVKDANDVDVGCVFMIIS